MIDTYEDAYEVGFKKIIINNTRVALSNLRLGWRFTVYRDPENYELWRIDFLDFDENGKRRIRMTVRFEDPAISPDETWSTWCIAEITWLLQENLFITTN
jgi:hypothetical protein